jgi:hypothetical protein
VAHATEFHELPARRIEAVSPALKTGIIALIASGAIAFVVALMTNPARAWQAYYINWLFVFSIAQGGFMLAV